MSAKDGRGKLARTSSIGSTGPTCDLGVSISGTVVRILQIDSDESGESATMAGHGSPSKEKAKDATSSAAPVLSIGTTGGFMAFAGGRNSSRPSSPGSLAPGSPMDVLTTLDMPSSPQMPNSPQMHAFLGCNHIETVGKSKHVPQLDQVNCDSCGTKSEVWICLVCYRQFCGRYQNSHMVEHHRDTGHCVTISLSDLSVWCYGCETYLQHEDFPRLSLYFAKLHRMKHNEEPVNVKLLEDPRAGTPTTFDYNGNGNLPLCPHVHEAVTRSFTNLKTLTTISCATCRANNVVENLTGFAYREDWLCLTCGGIYCGRYQHKHGLHHFQVTGHQICLSMVDLSVWCYTCMEYIDYTQHSKLQESFLHIRALKERGISDGSLL